MVVIKYTMVVFKLLGYFVWGGLLKLVHQYTESMITLLGYFVWAGWWMLPCPPCHYWSKGQTDQETTPRSYLIQMKAPMVDSIFSSFAFERKDFQLPLFSYSRARQHNLMPIQNI